MLVLRSLGVSKDFVLLLHLQLSMFLVVTFVASCGYPPLSSVYCRRTSCGCAALSFLISAAVVSGTIRGGFSFLFLGFLPLPMAFFVPVPVWRDARVDCFSASCMRLCPNFFLCILNRVLALCCLFLGSSHATGFVWYDQIPDNSSCVGWFPSIWLRRHVGAPVRVTDYLGRVNLRCTSRCTLSRAHLVDRAPTNYLLGFKLLLHPPVRPCLDSGACYYQIDLSMGVSRPFYIFFLFSSQSPHGSIPSEHLPSLRERLRLLDFDVSNKLIVVKAGDFYDDGWLTVYNRGTPQWASVSAAFDRVNFAKATDGFFEASNQSAEERNVASARGSKQRNLGFSFQSHPFRCPVTHLSIPGKHKDTAKYASLFASMSTLAHRAGIPPVLPPTPTDDSHPSDVEEYFRRLFRLVSFAGDLHVSNRFEACYPSNSDKDCACVLGHIDSHNGKPPNENEKKQSGNIGQSDHPDHRGYVCIAALCVMDSSNPLLPELKRLTAIATDRKCCDDFIHRIAVTGGFIQQVTAFGRLVPPDYRNLYPPCGVDDHTFLVDGVWRMQPASGNRAIAESAHVHSVRHFWKHFPRGRTNLILTLEVLLAGCWASDPIKFYWCIERSV